MKSILSSVAIFAAGAVTGGFIVWNYIKPKMEEAIQKAIEELSTPAEPEASEKEQNPTGDQSNRQMDMFEYHDTLVQNKYVEEVAEVKKPYVIKPEQFGDEGYDEVEYTYYADGILADETGEAIDDDDLEAWIGRENLKHMGEYEKDVLYIRNENQGTDYIVCRDLGTYASILAYDPFTSEIE